MRAENDHVLEALKHRKRASARFLLLAAIVAVAALLLHASDQRSSSEGVYSRQAAFEQSAGVPAHDDRVVDLLERWKGRVVAGFLLLATVIGAAAVLLLELAVVMKVYVTEFAALRRSSSSPAKARKRATSRVAPRRPMAQTDRIRSADHKRPLAARWHWLNMKDAMKHRSATYAEIRHWVEKQYGFQPETCHIAHAKELCGLRPRRAPNRQGQDRVKPCPPEKLPAITAAFRHFGMIP